MNPYSEIFEKQKTFYYSNQTKRIAFRKQQLRKLYHLIKANEDKIYKAIYDDFRKSEYESYETELGLIYKEIKNTIRKIYRWNQKKRVGTNLLNLPGTSYMYPEPYGSALIIGAWNYPFLLTLAPLVPAMAAGNTVILKPSELTKNSDRVLAEIINTNFDKGYIHVINGGVPETTNLLKLPFDKIFFTGSPRVGRIIMEAASKHLASITLELGGKSPTIVLPSANLEIAAKRIVWGKFINTGQSCIAPDYLLVHSKIKESLLPLMTQKIKQFYGEDFIDNEAYTAVINNSSYERLKGLIDTGKLYFGGKTHDADRVIEPTILHNISFEDPIMQEEIFGPILPVIEFEDIDEVIHRIKHLPKALAMYIFTGKKKESNRFIHEISAGGCAINDTMLHIANPKLPFGGIGNSGMGKYMSKAGFNTFTHHISVLKKATWMDPFFRYPPYNNVKKKLVRWILD